MIGLGAEDRKANAELARASALSLKLAPLLQGVKTALRFDLSLCIWLSWLLAVVIKELRRPANSKIRTH